MNIKHRGSLGFLLAAGLIIPAQLLAGGYKIPENSINSTALSAAYVANAHGADAAYFNPAAMVFNEDGGSFEIDATYIHLSAIKYDGMAPDDTSDIERFLVPTFHYVSPKVGNARFGLSVVAPAGLTKRWDGTGKAFSQQFTLKTVEINPTVAYEFNDMFSGAVGARVVYTDGVVKSKYFPIGVPGPQLTRDLEGDSFDYGYNLALHYKPTNDLALALTYRSKIDLTVEGEAELVNQLGGTPYYKGDAEVEVPIPAALNLAVAYTFNDKTTVELVYERTYWSAYKELDFDYDNPGGFVGPMANFDNPIAKDWSDSNSFRVGVTHKLNNMWTLMAGYAYDETPVPESTAGFELPDSDAHIFSVGARYQYSDNMDIGFGLLYDKKDKLTITPSDNNTGSSGIFAGTTSTFEDASAILLTVGMQYKF